MIDLFEDFLNDLWDSLPNLPSPISATGLPRPRQSQAKEDLTINGRTGECHGKHQLAEVGKRQETVKFPNKYGVMLEGHRDWIICKCQNCGVEERFIPVNVETKES